MTADPYQRRDGVGRYETRYQTAIASGIFYELDDCICLKFTVAHKISEVFAFISQNCSVFARADWLTSSIFYNPHGDAKDAIKCKSHCKCH